MPRDGFGREIDYLRISLTDHCNLRCVYCMPLEGITVAPSGTLLTAAEIEMVVRAALAVGFRKFRLTGGEPTLRPDLVDIVERIARLPGVCDLAMTTNGVRLPSLARPLAAAGLRPMKLNAVVARGFNEEDVVPLAELTLTRDWHVRFIETMPLGIGDTGALARAALVPSAETRARIARVLGPLAPIDADDPSDESRNYRLPGARGIVGFISPVTEPYCATCNRMRLTADGRFHLCLLNDDELDVRRALRVGGGLGEVADILLRAVRHKPTGHRLDLGLSTEQREMYQIGG